MARHPYDLDPPANAFDRLNSAERRVLALLAEGHTVKSIAQATGWTVPAVNERLRAARRKTGIGTSRELARRYAQENRHSNLGLADERQPGLPDHVEGDPVARKSRKGPWLMPLLVASAAAVAAALMLQPSPSTTAEQDPLLGNLLEERDTASVFERIEKSGSKVENIQEVLAGEGSHALYRRLHAQVRSESRDPAWAPSTEAKLKAVYGPALPEAVRDQARVICGSTVCEIVVVHPAGEQKAIEAFYDKLQSQPLIGSVEAAGLKTLTTMFTFAEGKRHIYLSYWRKAPAT